MRGRLNDGEERPDADLRERLHAMETKVRKTVSYTHLTLPTTPVV